MGSYPAPPNGDVVLIAEDSQDDINFLIRAFGEAGIVNPSRIVSTGEEAVDYLAGAGKYADREKFPFPSILFLDWVLPGKGGEEVLIWLGKRPERQRLLVVVLTGQEQRRRMIDAYRLGADSFLAKPVTVPDLMNVVAHFRPFWRLEASVPKGRLEDGHNEEAIPPLPQAAREISTTLPQSDTQLGKSNIEAGPAS